MKVRFKNDTGETIPAWAVIQVSSALRLANKRIYVDAEKPSTATPVTFITNGPVPVADGSYGTGRLDDMFWVATDAPATAGEEWGPVEDSWEIKSSGTTFLILLADADKALCCRIGDASETACLHAWVISAHGAITGGSFAFDLTIDSTTESIACAWDVTAAQLQTAIETHSKYGTTGTPTIEAVDYGPLPEREIHVKWSEYIEPPIIDSASVTGDAGAGYRSGSFSPTE